jgi:WD40 repeat protein
VWELEFSPDGSRLATSSGDGEVRIWALDVDDLIEIARGELTRGLTDAECSQYLHQAECPASS